MKSNQLTPEFLAKCEKDGVKFEMFLTSDVAKFVMDLVNREIYVSPSEAVFWMMVEYQRYNKHQDLREEVQKREIEETIKESENGKLYSSIEVFASLAKSAALRNEPAVWVNDPSVYNDDLLDEGDNEGC